MPQPAHALRLFVMRHAKSDWHSDAGTDHDRPLNARGRRDAPRMGLFLAATSPPDQVITSSAVRAQETVRLAAEAGAWTAPIDVEPGFYGSDPATVIERLRMVENSISNLLIAGHEPTSSHLIATLTGGQVHMPTAGLACIDLRSRTWSELRPSDGTLRWLVAPKLLRPFDAPRP